jgi:hypothetical protein
MKLLMITGGMFGFLSAIAVGLTLDLSWSSIFWHASVSACLTGWLLRWWGTIWIRSLRLAIIERLNKPPQPDPSPATTQPKS